jgi:hypothetical protein
VSSLRDFLLHPADATRPRRVPLWPGATVALGRVLVGSLHRPAARAAPAAGVAPAMTVLAPAQAAALGAALALLLARREHSGCALTCVWTGHEPGPATGIRLPAIRGAARLAAAARARGLAASASGRLVTVALPAAAEDAAADAARALAVAAGVPAVLALGGARHAAFDPLLAGVDRVAVVAGPDVDPVLRDLAVAGVAETAIEATGLELALGPVARLLAVAGAGVPPAVREALHGILAGDVDP